MTTRPPFAALRFQLTFRDGSWIGPGKADLLQGIAETGSIAAAGRRMKMSYKRAWGLVEVLNAMFAARLVTSSRGGAAHGGASLTPLGTEVLHRYRSLQAICAVAGHAEVAALADLAEKSDISGEK